MYSVQSSDLEYPSLISNNRFPHLCWTSQPSDGTSTLIQMDSLTKNENQNSKNQNILNPTSIIDQNESFQINNKDTLDLSDNFAVNSIVMTEWGTAKITLINKELQTVKLRIEDQEIEYPFIGLNPFLQIYVCIVHKDNIKWAVIKISLNETCYSIKNKIGKMFNVHPSRIILIFKEKKINDYNTIIYNLSFYEKAELLAVIRDPIEYCKFRFKNCDVKNFNSKFNSISVKTNVNVIITGIAFYKNKLNDIYYELIIKDNNKNIIFEADNIFVPKKDENEENSKKETYMVKYNLNKEIIFEKNKIYEIQQNFYNNIKDQYYGIQQGDNLADENGVTFTFSKTELNSENSIENSTKIEQGLIPGIYYSFK